MENFYEKLNKFFENNKELQERVNSIINFDSSIDSDDILGEVLIKLHNKKFDNNKHFYTAIKNTLNNIYNRETNKYEKLLFIKQAYFFLTSKYKITDDVVDIFIYIMNGNTKKYLKGIDILLNNRGIVDNNKLFPFCKRFIKEHKLNIHYKRKDVQEYLMKVFIEEKWNENKFYNSEYVDDKFIGDDYEEEQDF